MCGENQTVVGQAEDLIFDGPVHRPGITLLEVAAAGAADQQAVAGEAHAVIVGHITDATRRVSWRGTHLEVPPPEGHAIAMIKPQVGSPHCVAVALRDPDPALGRLSHQPGTCDVVGVAMCIEHGGEVESEFLQQRQVAEVLLEHGVDDHGLSALRITQKIRVGRRRRVEQLPEDEAAGHGLTPVNPGKRGL